MCHFLFSPHSHWRYHHSMIQRCNSTSGSITINLNSPGRGCDSQTLPGQDHCPFKWVVLILVLVLGQDRWWKDKTLALGRFQGNCSSGICLKSCLPHPSFPMPLETTWRKACLSSSLARKYCVNPCLFMMAVIRSDASEQVRVWFRQQSVWVPWPHQASPQTKSGKQTHLERGSSELIRRILSRYDCPGRGHYSSPHSLSQICSFLPIISIKLGLGTPATQALPLKCCLC